MRKRRRNPFGIGTGDVITIGAVVLGLGYLAATIKDILPGNSGTNEPVGTGGPGGAGGATPTKTVFTINAVDLPPVLRAGQPFTIHWTVTHIGPAGQYVMGTGLSPVNTLCLAGQHNGIQQTIEADLTVGDDSGPMVYKGFNTANYASQGAGLLSTYNYVRDYNGNKLTDFWRCDGVPVLPF